MSIIVPNNNQNSLINAVGSLGPAGILQLVRTAKEVYRNLPDTRKERNQARSAFERKLNMPNKKNNVIAGSRQASKSVVDFSSTSSNGKMAQRSMTGSRQLGSGGSGKGKTRKEKLYRSPYLDKIAVCFRAAQQLNNTALNAYGLALVLGIDSAGVDISTVMTQLTALGGIFREFRLMKLEIDFIPRVGSTAAGVIAVAVDRDPRTGSPSTSAEVIRRDPFFEVDIKQPGSLTWYPVTDDDKRWRYTLDATRPIEFLSHGSVIAYSSNDLALAANIGELFYNGWFEFAITK